MNSMKALYNLDAREIWIKGDITEKNYDDNVKCENKPSWADFIAERDRLDALDVSNAYKENRKAEYPTIEDCIHALLDGGATLTDLQAERQAIKDKYPKP